MSSRAVVRKKERRDRKREREGTEGKKAPFVRLGETTGDDHSGQQPDEVCAVKPKHRVESNDHTSICNDDVDDGADHETVAWRSRNKETRVEPTINVTSTKVTLPLQEEISIADSVLEKVGDKPESQLNRKERHKLLLAKRADKQLTRMQLVEARDIIAQKEREEIALANKAVGEDADGVGTAVLDMKDRHHPRFVGGTFWKDRKEKKAKTLFIGNLPKQYDQYAVKDLITSFVDSHGLGRYRGTNGDAASPQALPLRSTTMSVKSGSNLQEESIAAEQLNADGTIKANQEIGFYGAHCPVMSVDFIKNNNPSAKTHHAYVCFRTREMAVDACNSLDGYAPEHRNPRNKLRVNFSDDKDQRASAISRRDGSRGSGRGGRGGARGR